MQFDTIDMSRLVIMLWYDLIRFYKHVQTCHNIMIQFDTILQTCLNLSKKMMKYTKIHLKFLRNVLFFSWRQSYSLDRFDERAVKNCTCVPKGQLKFIYSEKATKFCEISTLLLSYVVPVKSKVDISQNFVAFSEYMKFNTANRNVHLIAESNSRLTYLPKCLQSSHKTIITIVCPHP